MGAKDKNLVEISLSEIDEAAKIVMDKDWEKQQERVWKMMEKYMLYRFINKACKWLQEQEEMVGISFQEDFIERFRKAMEEQL